MNTRYGVFNDEGCTDAADTLAEAEEIAAGYRAADDGRWADLIEVHPLCGEHEDQPRDACEDCADQYADG